MTGVQTCALPISETPFRIYKQINDDARPWAAKLIDILTPWGEAKKSYDTKREIEKREAQRREEERGDTIHQNIASIRALVEQHISSKSADIQIVIQGLKAERPVEWADEFADKAKVAVAETIAKLEELATMRKGAEQAEAKEAARQAAEEERNAELAKENKKKEAELKAQAAKLAEQQAEIDRQKKEIRLAEEREERARKEVIRQERIKKEREDREAKEKAEAEKKRQAERARFEKNFENTVEALTVYGIKSPDAGTLLNDIVGGNFENLKWINS